MEKKRWGVIYSSKVGSLKAYRHWLDIQSYMEKQNVQYDFVQSEGAGSVERLTTMLCKNGYETIVLVGNDASLNEALNGIMKQEELPENFAFGLLPNGIGNDFARFWNITQDDYKKSVDDIIERKTKKLDVGYCVFTDENNIPYRRYFLNCVNIGLATKLLDVTDLFTRLTGSKLLSMIPTALTNLLEQRSFKVRMKADSETIDQEVMSICIGNCYGYGQTPNAVPYNGMLDMSVVTRPKLMNFVKGFYLLGKGKFLNNENVTPYRVEKITIEDISKAKVSLDGKVVTEKNMSPVRIGVEPGVLNFIV